jgi:hypothetical protein
VIWKYILRSALIGTLTQIGLVFGTLLASAVVVETVFSWPGLGLFAYNSILQSDYNAIYGIHADHRQRLHRRQPAGRRRAGGARSTGALTCCAA